MHPNQRLDEKNKNLHRNPAKRKGENKYAKWTQEALAWLKLQLNGGV
jgi:hypothetical protein